MRRIVQLLLSLLAALPLHAALQLTLKAGEKTLHVTLAKDFDRRDDGTEVVIHDYAKRRMYSIDTAKKLYENDSLFVVLAGRQKELERRAAQGAVSPASEQELSLRGGNGLVAAVDADDERRYADGDAELIAWSSALITAKPADVEAFVRYFRYEFGGYPPALLGMKELAGIPKTIRTARGGQITKIEIVESKSVPDAPYSLGTAAEAFEDELLANGMRAVSLLTLKAADDANAKLLADAAKAADAQHFLPSMLGYLEYALVTDSDLPEAFNARRDTLMADENVQALLPAIQPPDQPSAEAALLTLERLQVPAAEKAHVLRVFHGLISGRLGNLPQAMSDYRAALTKEPRLPSVWQDLGAVALAADDPLTAWKCFDIARRLSTGSPAAKRIDDLEQQMLEAHPEYF